MEAPTITYLAQRGGGQTLDGLQFAQVVVSGGVIKITQRQQVKGMGCSHSVKMTAKAITNLGAVRYLSTINGRFLAAQSDKPEWSSDHSIANEVGDEQADRGEKGLTFYLFAALSMLGYYLF